LTRTTPAPAPAPAAPGHRAAGSRAGPRPPAGSRAGAFLRRHRLAPYALLAPALAVTGLLVVWPAVQIAGFSLQDYGLAQVTGAAPAQWVGLANFRAVAADPQFWLSLRNSGLFALAAVPLTLVAGTCVGLLLNRLGRVMATFVSTAALLAWATPAIAATVIFFWLFSPDGGVVDWLLTRLPPWLAGSPHWAGFSWTNAALPVYTVLTVLVVWQGFPFVAVSVLAGLKTVPAELLDAARVDGAGPWRAFWRVTYPLLKPVFLVLTLLSVIWDFGVFPQAYLLTGELANRDEYNLGIYAYQQAFTMPPSYGLGAALALILTFVLVLITLGYVRASIRQGALR
jgi:N,N'-diacetylchitobiose transport system permease protein